jgi:hypothetical protein
MPRVGFEPTIPAFEREKTFHALDSTAIVMGCDKLSLLKPNLNSAAFSKLRSYNDFYYIVFSGFAYRQLLAGSYLAYSSNLKMEAIHSPETPVDFCRTIRRPSPECLTRQFAMLQNWVQAQNQLCHLKVIYS